MDINSMMSTIEANKHAGRVASSLANHASGISTSATATRPTAAAAKSAAAATGSTTTTDNDNDITANDFLTLLVTEMQNQDPTQPTDPNAYIQQLVEVNSLQQLISINQDLTGTTSSSSSGSGSGGSISNSSGKTAPVASGGITPLGDSNAAPAPSLFSATGSGQPTTSTNA